MSAGAPDIRSTTAPGGVGGERTSAEHENGLLPIGPGAKGQDRLESLAADDQRIHRCHELIVAMGFATARREEIEVTIHSGNEAVEARANKDGCFHCRVLSLPPSSANVSAMRRRSNGAPGAELSPSRSCSLVRASRASLTRNLRTKCNASKRAPSSSDPSHSMST